MAYPSAVKKAHGAQLADIRRQGLLKEERYIHSPQAANIDVEYPAPTTISASPPTRM